ncbi:MAG: 16S rRNA processing protein RimM [Proteobacteria bacterium]|nr:16S rRNA processing protein RimM [Pseudomonadota bacterium]
MSHIDLRDLILIGHVIRPHGIAGLLRIVSYAQSLETFLQAGSVFMDRGNNEFEERKVIDIRPHGSSFLLRLSGLNSIEQTEIFKAAKIFIRKDSLIKKDEDEFFYYELLGLNVYSITGQYLGVVKEIFPTGSNDVYVVEGQGKEFLIPAIHQVIKEINIAQKRMVISPIKGLLEL